jgi:hypothetical protein
VYSCIKTITRPDVDKVSLRPDAMMKTRCDALFKKETVYVDVHRTELAYTSRSSPKFFVFDYIL